jgi:alkanesulfonate monooxygenase SsuD/methylene tetrahydromethanopterin reductase-like flavin-dependent oxidoreductase (luciferase family)
LGSWSWTRTRPTRCESSARLTGLACTRCGRSTTTTPKGYDALFPGGQFTAERLAARDALALGDVPGVIAAGEAMVDERAVFGTPDDVARQLRRYADAVDWALLYPPHFGVDAERVHANELNLIDVASGWTS